MDIQPDDCTLAHLAKIQIQGEEATDSVRRMEIVEQRKNGILTGFGCIACSTIMQLEGGIEGELKGVGLCKAPFASEARDIVAPQTAERARRIVEEALSRSLPT